jgi:hypothetical protein
LASPSASASWRSAAGRCRSTLGCSQGKPNTHLQQGELRFLLVLRLPGVPSGDGASCLGPTAVTGFFPGAGVVTEPPAMSGNAGMPRWMASPWRRRAASIWASLSSVPCWLRRSRRNPAVYGRRSGAGVVPAARTHPGSRSLPAGRALGPSRDWRSRAGAAGPVAPARSSAGGKHARR